MGGWLDSGSRHVVFGRGAEARGHIAPPDDLQERQPDPEPREHRRGGDTEAHHELLAGTVTINGVADDDEDQSDRGVHDGEEDYLSTRRESRRSGRE